MIVSPSRAISLIEEDRKKVNKRFELLRYVAQRLVEFNFPEEEYLNVKTVKVSNEKRTVHYALANEHYYAKCLQEAVNEVKMLDKFNESKRKPDEKTITSVMKSLVMHFSFITYMFPRTTLEVIDEDKAETNKRLDMLKYVCQALTRYGITENMYLDMCHNYQYSINTRIKNMVRFVFSSHLDEAYDIATYIENSDFAPYKSWWDRMFRVQKMDETMQAMLQRMLKLYVFMTNL